MKVSFYSINIQDPSFPLWKTLPPWSPPLPFLPPKHQIKTTPLEEISLSKLEELFSLSPWKSSQTAENKTHTEISTAFTLTINPRPCCASSKWQLKHFQILWNLLRQIQIVKTVQKAWKNSSCFLPFKGDWLFLPPGKLTSKSPIVS